MFQVDDISDFIAAANAIVYRDKDFAMRQRLNSHHTQADIDYERKRHEQFQKEAWDKVKEFFCNNYENVIKYCKLTDNKGHRDIINIIDKVIKDKADKVILNDTLIAGKGLMSRVEYNFLESILRIVGGFSCAAYMRDPVIVVTLHGKLPTENVHESILLSQILSDYSEELNSKIDS